MSAKTAQCRALFELLSAASCDATPIQSSGCRAVAAGMSGGAVESDLRTLKVFGPAWRLNVGCVH